LAGCILAALILKASTEPFRDGLASAMRRTVLAPLFSTQATAEKWRGALGSYDVLVAERDSALMRALELEALEAENERLSQLLMLAARLEWGFLPARVLHQTTPGLPTTLTLAAGSEHGVRVLSPVIAAEGLVGVVQSVGPRTSVIGLWTHSEFAAGAMSEDGSAFGIVSPHPGAGGSGYLLVMNNVQYRYALAPGARIVASGTGGVYPAMTPIGAIVEELETESGLSRRYVVRPHVRPQDLTAVIVLDPRRAAAGVGGIFLSPAQRDSARRVMITKGDSIIRARGGSE
jgi:rod shape-determining protein MreC